MRRSYLLTLLALSLFGLVLPGCTPAPNFWTEAKSGQKKVLVSFPPLYSITHAVAGDSAYVLCLLTTHGPHEYDGAATDLFKVNKADLFIYNGLTLDDTFADKMMRNHKNQALAILNVGKVLEEKHHDLLIHEEHEPGKDKKEAEPAHQHGEHDPHVWLGPPQAIAMTRIIAGELIAIDPVNKKGYQDRAAKFIDELTKLEAHGKAAFKDKKNKKIITMHEAFDYFAKAFDIDIVESIQKRPGTDPDAATMARLVALCQEKKVALIAVEPQYSTSQAETLQATLKGKGLDVKIVTLDPLETAPLAEGSKVNPDPGYYLKKMRANIDTLAKALP
jgi:zinc transport system substrate-binding protein